MTSIEMLDGDFAALPDLVRAHAAERPDAVAAADPLRRLSWSELDQLTDRIAARLQQDGFARGDRTAIAGLNSVEQMAVIRSEEHTSELQSLMRISYAVFCLKKKTNHIRRETQKLKNNNQ